jgi:DNA sulfur modification protein DndB
MENAEIEIEGLLGRCGDRTVFTGFATASLLSSLSFADTFEEGSASGYQRPFNRQHSLEFKRYIQREGASTIPLTFNLRPEATMDWAVIQPHAGSKQAKLLIRSVKPKIMSQVDCQHRLGYLAGSNIEFAFMAYLGLSVEEEMAIFRDINGKAKGLSSSLIDSTEARLAGDRLSKVSPELFYAMQLNENPGSVWYQRLNLGGKATVGTKRVASLRTMQHAVKRFLYEARLGPCVNHEVVTKAMVLATPWENPRAYLLTKGIGVYSLMSIGGELVREATAKQCPYTLDYFVGQLSDFLEKIDWSNNGPLMGYGGVKGADAALSLLRHTRETSFTKFGTHGKQEHPLN